MSDRNGMATSSGAPLPVCAVLRQLLDGGPVEELNPFDPATPINGECLPRHRAAVMAAVSTPDICLIQGEPASDAATLSSAIIAQSVSRGERVLVVAASQALLDRTLTEYNRIRDSAHHTQNGHAELRGMEAAAADLRPFADALQKRRWWTRQYWQARRLADPIGRLRELESRIAEVWADKQSSVVAVTTMALSAANFGPGAFDRLVVLDADRLSDSDLLNAASCARRWVLFGETSAKLNGFHGGEPPFQKLWRRLYVEPWGPENGRFVARLRPVPPNDRGRLTVEPLADRPEIELRILDEQNGMPQLAEVAFPSGITAEQARSYLVEQLGESPMTSRAIRLDAP